VSGLRSGVALARDGQSAQADFVCLLRRIHSLGWMNAAAADEADPSLMKSIQCR
jgi:hypothetical protein